MIFDTHTHIFPEKIAQKASDSVGDFYNIPMLHDGRVQTLLDLCRDNKVSRCLVLSVATAPEQVHGINRFLAETVRENADLFTGYCALHPNLQEAELYAELDYAIENNLRGIKLHPDFQRFNIDDKRAYPLYQAAQEKGLPILFHTGDRRHHFSSPARLARVLDDFPHLIVIAAHLGGWSEWEDGVLLLSGRENVFVDTSSSLYALTPEAANAYISKFGAGHVFFGTDYPMWDIAEELARLEALKLPAGIKENILYSNAARFFKLDA